MGGGMDNESFRHKFFPRGWCPALPNLGTNTEAAAAAAAAVVGRMLLKQVENLLPLIQQSISTSWVSKLHPLPLRWYSTRTSISKCHWSGNHQGTIDGIYSTVRQLQASRDVLIHFVGIILSGTNHGQLDQRSLIRKTSYIHERKPTVGMCLIPPFRHEGLRCDRYSHSLQTKKKNYFFFVFCYFFVLNRRVLMRETQATISLLLEVGWGSRQQPY